MAAKTKAPKKKLFDKFSEKTNRIASLVSAVIVLTGAITGICTWVSNQFQNAVSAQISDLKTEVQNNHQQTETQITRLELLNLIHNQPTNVAEIEKVAKHYFQDLQGDWYATGLYSQWCAEHGGDPSIAAGVK